LGDGVKKKRVLVAHNNLEFIEKVKLSFQESGLYTISGFALNGQDLINKVNLDSYDIVIVKNALTQVTGLYALESLLMNTKLKPELIVVITPFVNQFILNKCEILGIDYLKDVNITVDEIHELLSQLEIKKAVIGKKYFDAQVEIINLLKKIGLLKAYIGYTYFEYVLNIMLEKSENINKYMKTINLMVADHFNVSSSSVEKAMRKCVKESLSRCDGFYAKMLFGHQQDSYPSTSIFLRVCVKTLKEQKSQIVTRNFENSMRKI